MMLFEDKNREEKGFKPFAEDLYSYLNRSARREHAIVRKELEKWFSRYPQSEKKDLWSRFTSSNEVQHRAAFFELYLHEMLLNMDCDVVIHPNLPDTTYSPDFLVSPKAANEFYLEAKLITFESEEERSQKARKNEVFDVLNRHVDSSNFFIGLDLKGAPDQPPPAKEIANFVNRKLSEIEPDTILEIVKSKGLSEAPSWKFISHGWEIEFFPIPKNPDKRGDDSVNPLGLFSPEAGFVNHDIQIKNAILKKAGKYGNLDLPFIIAANMLEHVDHIDIMNALFGSEVFIIRTEQLTRKPNGIWRGPKGARNTSISGILCFTQLGINTISKIKPYLYENPWAKQPCTSTTFDSFSRVITENGKVNKCEGNTASAIFGLPFDWPKIDKVNE